MELVSDHLKILVTLLLYNIRAKGTANGMFWVIAEFDTGHSGCFVLRVLHLNTYNFLLVY